MSLSLIHISQLLLQFMEQMIEDDVLYLSHIESETEKMEENIGSCGSTDFFPLLTKDVYKRQMQSEWRCRKNDYHNERGHWLG